VSTPRTLAEAVEWVEERLPRMKLSELARLLGWEEGHFFCGWCQDAEQKRILQGPTAQLLGRGGPASVPREATRWACSRCGLQGTRSLLVRLLLENPNVLEEIGREVMALDRRADR
jgi:hypothetical protein